jgi:hypothetical protein
VVLAGGLHDLREVEPPPGARPQRVRDRDLVRRDEHELGHGSSPLSQHADEETVDRALAGLEEAFSG